MIVKKNPFNEVAFDKQTKILLDACVILSIIDEDNIMHNKCNNEIEKIMNQNSKFYTSNVVLSEVINKIINEYFINDMRFVIDETNPRNSDKNINKILSCFNIYEQEILLGISDIRKIRKINFKKYFDKINKGKCTDIPRDVLKVYFVDGINIVKDFIKKYDINTLIVNKNMMDNAQNIMVKYMLGVNDAQHLATGIGHRVDYLLSCDGDFGFVEEDYTVKMLRIV